jgi:hypothetical protein
MHRVRLFPIRLKKFFKQIQKNYVKQFKGEKNEKDWKFIGSIIFPFIIFSLQSQFRSN